MVFVVMVIVCLGWVDFLVVVVIIFVFIKENMIIVIFKKMELILFGRNFFLWRRFDVFGDFIFGIKLRMIVFFKSKNSIKLIILISEN